jgi:diguanylate cyclase (GGDEF)-like protein
LGLQRPVTFAAILIVHLVGSATLSALGGQLHLSLDSRTVYAISTASLLLTAAIVAFAARAYADDLRRLGLRWALAVALSGLGFGAIVVRGFVPDWLSILGGHVAGVAGAAVFADAAARFAQRASARAWLWAPPLLAAVEAAWFYLARPDYAWRMVLFSSLVAVLLGRAAWLLLRQQGTLLRSPRVVGAGFAVCAALMALRAVVSLSLPPATAPAGIFHPGTVEQVAILGTFLCYFGLSFSFVVICNERLSLDLRRLAAFDALTELYNRRTIEDVGRHEVARARRSGAPLTLALLDVDRFKEINDEHGHLAGDSALRAVAALLERTLRAQDMVGRWGGDELLVLMPATDLAQGTAALERVRSAVEQALLDPGREAPLRLTVSIGLAGVDGHAAELTLLLRAADEALYEAKRRGRNRVCARAAVVTGTSAAFAAV